jgi:hypothetical protein
LASTKSDLEFARSYGWVLNRSLSFGLGEWDVLALPRSLAQPVQTDQQSHQELLVRRLILGRNLSPIVRRPKDDSSAEVLLSKWIKGQLDMSASSQSK